jgi:hypothetical protein
MTTIVIDTVENDTSPPEIDSGRNLLITATGGVINSQDTAISANVAGVSDVITVDGFVYGGQDGIDLILSGGENGVLNVNGSVQGANTGTITGGGFHLHLSASTRMKKGTGVSVDPSRAAIV